MAEAVVALAAATYAIRAVRRGPAPARERGARRGGAWRQAGLGVLVVLAWLIDPIFLANAALAGRAGTVSAALVSQLAWALVAQCFTTALALGMLVVSPTRMVDGFERWWSAPRARVVRNRLVVAVLAVVALLLAADVASYLVAREYLL